MSDGTPPPRKSEAERAIEYHLEVARNHARTDTGTDDATTGRSLVRRALLRVARPFMNQQFRFNDELLAAVGVLAEEQLRSNAWTADLVSRLGSLEEHVSAIAAGLDAAGIRLKEYDASEAHLQRLLGELPHELNDVRAEIRTLRTRLDTTLRAVGDALPDDMPAPRLRLLQRGVDEADDALYLALEEAFRGSRELVQSRISLYLPDIEMIGGPVLDLGSGRNEWLELLASNGIEASGVDTNSDFVADARARGLSVTHGDALEHLAAVPEGSLGAVTAFHLAEHLEFDSLIRLIGHALRALRPGGLLLLETPNPTNLVVGANTFYLDPTHLKPLQPLLVEFLLVHHGFATAEIRYMQPGDLDGVDLAAGREVPPKVRIALDRLQWALFGPQDYAALGRKATGNPPDH